MSAFLYKGEVRQILRRRKAYADIFLIAVTLIISLNTQAQNSSPVASDPDTLKEMSIGEVVIIGYGSVRKGDETGSVTAIKADDKVKGFAPNAQDMLVGKIAGVVVTTEGGSPSGGSAIRIRGGSSLSASNDPLIIIDGVPIDNGGLGGAGNILNAINPNDIETFTVLKDASATAIYGSRASNGVILITTKKGKGKGLRVTYDGNISLSRPKKFIDVLNADEYRNFINSSFAGQSNYNEISGKLGSGNTDWQKAIFRTAYNTEHNLSLLGSVKDQLPYRVSLGYSNLNGILKTSSMERYTASLSLSPTFFDNHLKVTLNGRGMLLNNRFANQDAIGSAIVMDPTQHIYDENSPYGGYFTWNGVDGTPIQVATKNPVSILDMTRDVADIFNFIGNTNFEYKTHFLPELKLNMNLGLDYSKSNGTKRISELSPSDFIYGGYDSKWSQQRRNSNLDIYGQYVKNLGFLNSQLDLMGGYSWQHYYREGDNVAHRISRFDDNGDPLLVSESDYATENYILSFYGRLNYNINNRYLLTFTLREDGSSRFSSANRWSLFPSTAVAWKINEDLFPDSRVVSDLKLRLGWGVTGQQDINQGDYPYLGTYLHSVGSEANYLRGYNNGIPVWVSLLRPEAYNPDLKWETTQTYNAGLDFGLYRNRVEGAIDFYYRKTDDLINAETKVPAGTNFREYVAANIGSLENRGVEFSLNARAIVRDNFGWDIGGNISYNRNKILSLSYADNTQSQRRYNVNVHQVGQPAGMFYLYEQIYDTEGRVIEGFYKDQNNDGLINEKDLITYHKPAADVNFGITTKLRWKSWDFAIASHGSIGNYNYNSIAAGGAALSSSSVYANEFLVNRPQSAFETNFQTGHNLSTHYVENASFWRIDNINLGWNYKGNQSIFRTVRIYATVQNPLVITKYTGLDPEVFGGIDGNVYPRPLTILFGTNLTF